MGLFGEARRCIGQRPNSLGLAERSKDQLVCSRVSAAPGGPECELLVGTWVYPRESEPDRRFEDKGQPGLRWNPHPLAVREDFYPQSGRGACPGADRRTLAPAGDRPDDGAERRSAAR